MPASTDSWIERGPAHETQTKLSNYVILIKYESSFYYCFAYFSPQMFSEANI